jgi:phospholipid transport system substrate-binding protein
MKKSLSTFLIIVLLTISLCAETMASGPQASVKQLLEEIRQIKPNSSVNNQKHSQSALSMLNVAEISKKVLGKYWTKCSEKEKEKFEVLLGELFVYVAFPSSAQFFAELDLVYGKIKETPPLVVVPLTVVHEKEGEVGIDFHLIQNRNNWQVVDVILDGVSMRNNLRSQLYKIIKKKNFNELIRKMDKKLISAKS